jgi:hypothetical protein
MGMGFPDIIIERDLPKMAKRKEVKKPVTAKASTTCTREAVYCTKLDKASKAKQPRQKLPEVVSMPGQAVASLKDIYLKLFDKKGNLLLIENIKVEEFLSRNYPSENLPEGSTFVMFHGNTAYYYIENAG